jgi:HD-GYP domain-containing protein (c-di-GMP phosphodiesterase class II)
VDRTKQLRSATNRIELTYDEPLEVLGAALALRDNETAGHSRCVTNYSLEVARAMGLKGEPLKHLAHGAYLHDSGKIGIPDSILLKPGKLTAEERAVMQTHARIGYHLASCIAFLAQASEIVLTHQERSTERAIDRDCAGKKSRWVQESVPWPRLAVPEGSGRTFANKLLAAPSSAKAIARY